jgi:hypothetical protein
MELTGADSEVLKDEVKAEKEGSEYDVLIPRSVER